MRVAALLVLAVHAAAAQETKEILDKLTEITGLAILKPVAQSTMKREELKDYFDQRIKEVIKPEEIRIEELTLKKFGFVPPDFDLKKNTVELMAEQAAAFYDYRKHKMVLLESTGGGGMMEEMALVHELAHALADQHFHLERFLKKGHSSDDSAVARAAVMEGQATYVMSEYLANKSGQSLVKSPAMMDTMARMAGAGGSGYPVFESMPLYMRESLVFPYAKGMLFQHKVVEKYGQKGYAEVFARPPATTQEILHPDKYFLRITPVDPRVPDLPSGKGWKKVADGTVGEFDHGMLLRQYANAKQGVAEFWRGGRYHVWERKQDRRSVLAYASAWEDPVKAREFFLAYRDVVQGKWKKCEITGEAEDRFSGKSEDGFFRVVLSGTQVSSLEGLEQPVQ